MMYLQGYVEWVVLTMQARCIGTRQKKGKLFVVPMCHVHPQTINPDELLASIMMHIQFHDPVHACHLHSHRQPHFDDLHR